jgi:hypothetical protein
MGIPNRQIGWSNESNLLWQILKQLNQLTSVMFGLKPKYKVYTALLTQSGVSLNNGNCSDDPQPLVIGVTYKIDGNDGTADFTNVGAPNNNNGTYFVATGTTPNSWGTAGPNCLSYDEGAPVVTVLENTIGNVWFTYTDVGNYALLSNELFTLNKSWSIINPGALINNSHYQEIFINDISQINIFTSSESVLSDSILSNAPIEIRVYN